MSAFSAPATIAKGGDLAENQEAVNAVLKRQTAVLRHYGELANRYTFSI